MLHVDYIDNFETKALDVLRDLSAEAECRGGETVQSTPLAL